MDQPRAREVKAFEGWAELLRGGRLSGDRLGEALEAPRATAPGSTRFCSMRRVPAAIRARSSRSSSSLRWTWALRRIAMATLRPAA
jgi:hypothetical protein